MKYFIGADLGTSSLKLLLVDGDGNILNKAVKNYSVSYPSPGWSEQDPNLWWSAFVDGIKELLCGFDSSLVSGIGIGGQMHGLVALDKNDNVIRPCILWNDGRTAKDICTTSFTPSSKKSLWTPSCGLTKPTAPFCPPH